MEKGINEDFLLIIKEDLNTRHFEISTKVIEKPLHFVKEKLFTLLDDENTTLESIISFIIEEKKLLIIEKIYPYCSDLVLPFQRIQPRNEDIITQLQEAITRIKINNKIQHPDYDPLGDTLHTKAEIKAKYDIWFHAFEIHLAYRQCHDDSAILSFSHRISGWSNPVHKLTTNFSLEFKTNFGFGRSSYFYTKLTYKGVEITPVSEWVKYEYAEFIEIVRYSKRHDLKFLKHDSWREAMEFAQLAFNLSRTDENGFVERFIIMECKEMVDGLIYAMTNTKFYLLNAWHQPYWVDKKGHVLMQYRGEKISGALDFIKKIIELEHITNIKRFIDAIKECNQKLKPALDDELVLLEDELVKAKKDLNNYEPTYVAALKQNNEYAKFKEELKVELIKTGVMSWKTLNLDLLQSTFKAKFKDYEAFYKDFILIEEKWRKMIENLLNLQKFKKNISTYKSKIISFLSTS